MSLVYMSDKSGKQKGEAMFYPLSCCLGVGLFLFYGIFVVGYGLLSPSCKQTKITSYRLGKRL